MPGIPVDRPLVPYVSGQTLGQLLRLSADHRAEAVQRQGELSAQLWSGLGQQIGSAITGYAKEKQEAPIRAQEQQIRDLQLRQANQADLDQRRQQGITSAMDAALKASMVTDPSTGATIYDRNKLHASMADVGVPETELAKYGPLLDQSDKAVAAVHAARGEALKHSAALIEMAGNDPAVFKSEIQRGIKNNLFTAEDAQPYLDAAEKDPTHIGRITGSILGRDPNAGQFTLEPGAVRVGPDGKVIASNPKPVEPSSAQSKDVLLDGKPAIVVFDPKTRTYTDGTGADVTARVKPIPPASVQVLNQTMGSGGVTPTAQAIAEYRIPPPSPRTLASAPGQALMRAVLEANPEYDSTQYPTRQKMRTAFTSGPQSQTINSLNTAIGHLDQFTKVVDALDNGNFRPGNEAYNWLRATFGDSAPTNFAGIKSIMAGELASAFKKSGATDQEIASVESAISARNSASQLRDYVTKIALPALGSKVVNFDQQYRQVMGQGDPFKILLPESEAVLKKYGIDPQHPQIGGGGLAPAPAAGRVRVIGPNGETGTVPAGAALPSGWRRQ